MIFHLQEEKISKFWKNDGECSSQMPFCFKKFKFRMEPEAETSKFKDIGIDTKSRFYIFKLLQNMEDRLNFIPKLPLPLNKIAFEEWFQKNILPLLNKNKVLSKNSSFISIKGKAAWYYQDISLLYNKCDLNIYLKAGSDPMIFVFLWQEVDPLKRELIHKLEKWSTDRISSFVSIDDNIEGAPEI